MQRVILRFLYLGVVLRVTADDEIRIVDIRVTTDDELTFVDIERLGCSAPAVGFGEERQAKEHGESLVDCGVTLMRQVLPNEVISEILDAFLQLPEETLSSLRHGAVREKRLQTHVPFEPPFSDLDILSAFADGMLADPLEAALGSDFVIDLVTVVEVPAGAELQDPHRDTALEGSISAHIPLHALEEDMAPLGMCAGTHLLSGEETKRVVKESLLYRRPGETSQVAKRRLYCGGHHKTDVMHLSVSPGAAAAVRVRDSRLGVSITNLKNKKTNGIEWQVGDEITHINGKRINHSEDWDEVVGTSGNDLDLRLERPSPDGPPNEPPLMVVGAPLNAGDVILYDSRIFHWGMKNNGSKIRYALYVSFKKSPEHEGVHPEAHGTPELLRARDSFADKLKELRSEFGRMDEL